MPGPEGDLRVHFLEERQGPALRAVMGEAGAIKNRMILRRALAEGLVI